MPINKPRAEWWLTQCDSPPYFGMELFAYFGELLVAQKDNAIRRSSGDYEKGIVEGIELVIEELYALRRYSEGDTETETPQGDTKVETPKE